MSSVYRRFEGKLEVSERQLGGRISEYVHFDNFETDEY